MSRFVALMLLLFGSLDFANAQTSADADTREFELTAVAPPKPALQYQLLFHDAADRLNGNAAILYFDAILMMGTEAKANGAKALDAFTVLFDEQFKLRTLPYHELLPRVKDQTAVVDRLREEQPGNPFQVYGFEPTVRRFAQADRQLAALTAVEALRSYAAANNGRLPAALDDVSDTPVPINPATGRPFEYQLDGATATLSDTQFEPTLKYVVRIRK
jgi:hypothetical protein